MKSFIITLCLLATVGFNSIVAQEKILVEAATIKTPSGDVPAFSIKIFQADISTVGKAWAKELTRGQRSKIKKSANEYSIQGVVINQITVDTINVLSTLSKQDYGVQIEAAFETKSGFINEFNTNQPVIDGAKAFLYDFAASQYQVAVRSELKSEEKNLRKLNSRLNSLIRQNTSLRKGIASSEQQIMNLEEDIKLETSLREQKNEQINNQRVFINQIRNNPEQLKIQQANLKTLEKERKAILKKIEKSHKKIVSLKSFISKSNRNIAINEEQQILTNNEIRKQMSKNAEIENKLKGIR